MSPRLITRFLAVGAALLVVAGLAGQVTTYVFHHDYVMGLIPLFDLDGERNIPATASALVLFVAAVLLAVLADLHRISKRPDVAKWILLSCGFVAMGFDEVIGIHEQLILPMRVLLGGEKLGIFYFAWVVPGIALVAVIMAFLFRFVLQLPPATRRRVILAASLYLAGAIGFELVGGAYAEQHGIQNPRYRLITTVEECLELAGLIFFVHALLSYLADEFGQVTIQFGDVRKEQVGRDSSYNAALLPPVTPPAAPPQGASGMPHPLPHPAAGGHTPCSQARPPSA